MIRNIAAYHFVAVDNCAALAATLREHAEIRGLRGTVLVAPEGLNAFLAGDAIAIDQWLEMLRTDPRFAMIAVKSSDSTALPFARLKVKVKREIIAFRQDAASPLAHGARARASRRRRSRAGSNKGTTTPGAKWRCSTRAIARKWRTGRSTVR